VPAPEDQVYPLIEEAFSVDTTTNPIQGEAGMTTTKDWDAVDWSNDDDIIASVAPWITPQELDAIREKTARLKQAPASIRVAIKFTLAEAVIDAAVKANTQG
jgi:hypothetical protein